MPFSTKLAKIIFIVTALLLLIISTILYVQINDLVDANEMVNHTNEVKFRLEQILSYSKDAETAQRGYLLTKDSLFLQPYFGAFEKTNISLGELRDLTRENKQQSENVNKLDSLVKIRFASFSKAIDSFYIQGSENARKQILLKEKSLLDSVRRQTNKMENIEIRLKGERERIQNKHAFLAPVVAVLLFCLSLAVLLAAYYRILLDLNQSKNFASQMKILNEDLLEKNRQLEITNQELDSFNYITSHDLQEPVRKIRTFISMIEETDNDRLTEKSKHNFQRMEAAAIRIQKLLNDLLTYSQLKNEGSFRAVDLNKIMEDVKNKFSKKINETQATFNYQHMPTINGSAFQLQQLFEQLTSNSFKYKKETEAPKIKIECILVSKESIPGGTIHGEAYKISFIDNGIGFDQENENKVFELFSRLHSKDYTGTGIGLTICRKIIQNHNGVIKVKSMNGEGTRFDIFLPA